MIQPYRIPSVYRELNISTLLGYGHDHRLFPNLEPLYKLDFYTLNALQRYNDDIDTLSNLISSLFKYYDFLVCKTGLKDSSF